MDARERAILALYTALNGIDEAMRAYAGSVIKDSRVADKMLDARLRLMRGLDRLHADPVDAHIDDAVQVLSRD